MIDVENTVLWKEYNGLRFMESKGPFSVLYFSENSTFLRDKSYLGLRKQDFRKIYLTNTNVPRTHTTGTKIQNFRENDLIAYDINSSKINQNNIIDSTEYVDKIDMKYKPYTYQNRYGDMIFAHVYGLFSRISNDNRKIFLYSYIKNSSKNNYTKNKFFVFLKAIKNNNICYDDLILCKIQNKKATYKFLIKDRIVDYNRILFHIRNL